MPHILPKLTVVYDPFSGLYCRDSEAEELVNSTIENFFSAGRNMEIRVATNLLINYFRLALCRGRIGVNNIEFKFMDQLLAHNEDGQFSHWPEGFCDYDENVLMEILTGRGDLPE